MNKKIITKILQVTIALAILGIFIFGLFGINLFSKDGFVKIPTLISSIVLFWGFYFSWGWKWPYLRKLVYKENINGTWVGTYESQNFTSNSEFKGEIALVIRQSFLNINVKSHTDNYINHSFGEALNHTPDSDSHQLIYLYSQSEFKPSDDNVRKGTSGYFGLMVPVITVQTVPLKESSNLRLKIIIQ